jgi:capsular polysaccharide biosynthesis protein
MALIKDIDFIDDYVTIIKGWWLIVLFALVGGLLGLLLSVKNPPIYEGRSTIIVVSDFESLNKKSWTDYKVDLVNNHAALLVNSLEIRNKLIAEYSSRGVDIQSGSFSLERRMSKWDMVFRYTDSVVAADVANSWLEMAVNTLDDTRQNSLQVLELNLKLDELVNCSRIITSSPFCSGITNGIQLSEEIKKLTAQLDIAERNSKGISVVMTFERGEEAKPQTKPVLFDRNIFILIGSIIGLLTGSLWLLIRRDSKTWFHR